MIVTHKPIELYAETVFNYRLLWTRRGFQIAVPGDWVVVAPTGCVWRIKKKDHKYYNSTNKLYNLKTKP